MTKTNLLIELLKTGNYKVDGLAVYRRTASGEWVRSTIWRKDIVVKAAAAIGRV